MNDAMKALIGKGEWTPEALEQYFRAYFEECIQLMLRKNRDYGNSWMSDRPTTLTDTIKHKVDRVINLENVIASGGHPRVDENIGKELPDIINYTVFRSIKEGTSNE